MVGELEGSPPLPSCACPSQHLNRVFGSETADLCSTPFNLLRMQGLENCCQIPLLKYCCDGWASVPIHDWPANHLMAARHRSGAEPLKYSVETECSRSDCGGSTNTDSTPLWRLNHEAQYFASLLLPHFARNVGQRRQSPISTLPPKRGLGRPIAKPRPAIPDAGFVTSLVSPAEAGSPEGERFRRAILPLITRPDTAPDSRSLGAKTGASVSCAENAPLVAQQIQT